MADRKQLEILKQGVAIWNDWIAKNLGLKPEFSDAKLSGSRLSSANFAFAIFSRAKLASADLSQADLSHARLLHTDLSGANLSNINLSGANLSNAKLKHANLTGANLTGAKLSHADLSGAKLSNTQITEAKLSNANLTHAKLINAMLFGAKLINATLTGVKLLSSDCSDADLSDSKLQDADLSGSKFTNANLSHCDFLSANLTGVDFSNANLSYAVLARANLSDAILTRCKLNHSDLRDSVLSRANLTGACLYRSAIDGWRIDNIKCDYIYFDEFSRSRQPKDRDFELSEFERLYRSIPTIEFVFKHGMKPYDPMLMDWISAQIQDTRPELGVELLSIDRKGVFPRATFSIASQVIKDDALKEIKTRYEETIHILKQQNDNSKQIIEQLLAHNRLLLDQFQQPKQIHLYGGKYVEMHDNAQFNETYMMETTRIIEEIKGIIQREPEKSFQDKSKKKILEYIDHVLKDLTKDGVKIAGKKLLKLAETDLVPLLPQIASYLDTLRSFCGF